ncbi:uncharacterized protein LOC108706962 [Xenopus laevis]|uniref:Uncharacterized protein LOC108706962 n=2 Tax=Xenopus laevis TaxID=8355 RepID=A0A1L8HP81_XENLA|nr:uncharacterized protein LOC108706962 [Xenopus laevis]XP_018099319.1 uncharacterized protein LOC108706962 [Xenopus laevis]OCT97851.1 hypothetical protein XELAEV_18010083mg [Xenopus laevis]
MTMGCCCTFILLYSLHLQSIASHGIHILQGSQLPYHGDEVGLLSESLLQFGSMLNKEVNYTKESITNIFEQLDIFNMSLAEMSRKVIQIATAGENLTIKAKSHISNDTMPQLVDELSEEIARVQLHGASLEDKIKPLERRMRKAVNMRKKSNSLSSTAEILSFLERQNIRIEALMAVVDIHQKRINTQEAKIQRLLRKTGLRKKKSKEKNNERAREKTVAIL